MKKVTLLLLTFLLLNSAHSQISKQPPENGVYAVFAKLSGERNTARSWMDTVHFPPKEYGSSLLWTMVKPYYLTSAEIKALTKLTTPPANSSDRTRKELDYLLELQANRTPDQSPI